MRLWWVSISLFMELEGEQGMVILSCCSSNGIPHWLMRLERSEEFGAGSVGVAFFDHSGSIFHR